MKNVSNVARIHLKTAKSYQSDNSASSFILEASSVENILRASCFASTFTDKPRPSVNPQSWLTEMTLR